MNKLLDTMKEKGMQFLFLVGDLPPYKLILRLQIENPDKILNVLPIVGVFQQQMSYTYVIYKCFLSFGISDLLISVGMIVEGTVDQPFRRIHYRPGLRCIML